MSKTKKEIPRIKTKLHPRNRHRQRYDFDQLIKSCPDLEVFVKENKYGDVSIDFFDPAAVKMLNKALLMHHYQIDHWDIPPNYLCPPIPGRADYIHYLADLLAAHNRGKIPKGKAIRALDIGVGANCIYPIIGHREYGWSFIGSEIDPIAVQSAEKIAAENALAGNIEIRLQKNPRNIFHGILEKEEIIDVVLCNPPFYESLDAANAEHLRKRKNLKQQKNAKALPNFGGQNKELWCEGGEKKFVAELIRQSKIFATSCFWFSTLISREAHLESALRILKKAKASKIEIIPMAQGNKTSRILAWTFLNDKQQKIWASTRWK